MSVYYLFLPTVGVAADSSAEELVRMALLKGRRIFEKDTEKNSWSADKLLINFHVLVRFVFMQHVFGDLTGAEEKRSLQFLKCSRYFFFLLFKQR